MRSHVRWFTALCIAIGAVALLPTSVFADARAESGKFRLYEYEQAVGEETYAITRQGDVRTLTDDFRFVDFHPEALHTTLRTSGRYVPEMYAIKGDLSRSDVDTEVAVRGSSATARVGKESRTIPIASSFFTISDVAPAAVHMEMMRYWLAHGSPQHLPILPSGEVTVLDRGEETVNVGHRRVRTERYIVRGITWGMETLWLDRDHDLVALVWMVDYSQFAAIREEYAPSLRTFIQSAARDEMAVLAEAARPSRYAGALALVGATVIDATGKPPIPDATVVTIDGKIAAVGPSGSVPVPPGTRRIDLRGKFIIPGLWDMHAHYEQVEWGPVYLAAGVTTVRDLGSALDYLTEVRDQLNRGNGLGPHMLMAGIVDGDPASRAIGMARVNSPKDARTWVQRYHDAGFEQIKIYSSVQSANVKAICDEAHRLGMTVTGHVPEGMDAFQAVEDGMDMINHIEYLSYLLLPKGFDRDKVRGIERMKVFAAIDVNSAEGKRAVEFLRQHGTVIDPTVALLELQTRPASLPLSDLESGFARMPAALRDSLDSPGIPEAASSLAAQILQRGLDIVGALHRAGVPIVAGTDQVVPGYSLYREMELYQRAGFTPLETLQSATIVPARVMKADAVSGTIEIGKRADLDVLDANPLDDIHHVRTMRLVVANGVLYDPKALWSVAGFKPE